MLLVKRDVENDDAQPRHKNLAAVRMGLNEPTRDSSDAPFSSREYSSFDPSSVTEPESEDEEVSSLEVSTSTLPEGGRCFAFKVSFA